MNQPSQINRNSVGNGEQKVKSTLDRAAIERLKDLALDNRVLDELETEDTLSIEELQDLEQSLHARDPNFHTELEYDGYKDIEDYDNDEYRADVGEERDSAKELKFSDRFGDETLSEENIVDKQDNHH